MKNNFCHAVSLKSNVGKIHHISEFTTSATFASDICFCGLYNLTLNLHLNVVFNSEQTLVMQLGFILICVQYCNFV